MKAVVVGAGIGGLGAALALARQNWAVEVLEQAGEIRELGAGVQISPNGMRVLDWLGVGAAVRAAAFEPEAVCLRGGRSGRVIFRLPMRGYAARRWGAPFLQIHRADLQYILLEALQSREDVMVRTATRATGYVRERGGASVYRDRGERVYGDFVVAADGIRSVLRDQMLGQDRARFTGNVAWRLTVPRAALGAHVPPPDATIWSGPARHAITTWLRGGELCNFVGIVEQPGWTEEGWTLRGEPDALRADFHGWHPSLQSIIEKASGTPYRWALHDRPPLARWRDGPVVLLGDAAHPMLPSMAQGAVAALEDAVVLARCLAEDAAAAPVRYERARKPRATRIQTRSRQNLTLFHRRGLARFALNAPLAIAGRLAPGALQGQQDWIYHYDATRVAL